MLHYFNNALSSSEYPASLKYLDITPIFKKDDKNDIAIYNPELFFQTYPFNARCSKMVRHNFKILQQMLQDL